MSFCSSRRQRRAEASRPKAHEKSRCGTFPVSTSPSTPVRPRFARTFTARRQRVSPSPGSATGPAAPSGAGCAALLARCRGACRRMGGEGGEYWILNDGTAARYLAGVTQRMFQKWPEACTDSELERTALALEQRADRLAAEFRAHAQTVATAQRTWVERRDGFGCGAR